MVELRIWVRETVSKLFLLMSRTGGRDSGEASGSGGHLVNGLSRP